MLAAGVALGLFVGAVQQSLHGLLSRESWNWAEMALYAVGWGLLAPPAWWLGRRAGESGWVPQHPSAAARARRSKLVAPAVRAGALPADADPEVWRPALLGAMHEMRGQRWLAVALAVVGGGLTGAAAAVANDNAWSVWAVAVVVTAEGLLGCRLWTVRLRVARRLRASIQTP
jgi:hypothetical protein